MSNVKISLLPEETSLTAMTGIAGYNASETVQISGANILSATLQIGVTSTTALAGDTTTISTAQANAITNSLQKQASGTTARVGFFGGDGQIGGDGSLTYDNSTNILTIGDTTFEGAVEIVGNYVAGNNQPKLTFKGGDSNTANSFDFVLTTDGDSVNQTWILPPALPTAGQVLKASGVSTNDVTLDWGTGIEGSGTALKLPLFSNATTPATTLTDSVISQTTVGGDPILTLESSDIRTKEKISHSENPADTFIGFTADGVFEVTTDGSEAIACGTSGQVELKQSGVTVAKTINHGLELSGNGVLNGFAGRLRINCDQNNHYVDILGPDHASNTAVSYVMQLPNKIATEPAYSTGGRILEINATGEGQWINTPTASSGGVDAFTTLTSADAITWDASVSTNAKIQLGNFLNVLSITNATSGMHFSLLIDASTNDVLELSDTFYGPSNIPQWIPAIPTADNYVIQFFYDGSNFFVTTEANTKESVEFRTRTSLRVNDD